MPITVIGLSFQKGKIGYDLRCERHRASIATRDGRLHEQDLRWENFGPRQTQRKA